MQTGILGSGNLATQLTSALVKSGFPPSFISGRNRVTGRRLAKKYGIPFYPTVPHADEIAISKKDRKVILFICTPDDSVAPLFKQLNEHGYTLVHCSGSLPLLGNSLTGGKPTGVFYPLQTFTKTNEPDWTTLPVCIEASHHKLTEQLEKIGRRLSRTVIRMNSEKRAIAHLSAVFANNFTNAQLGIAGELMKEHGLPISLLHPLIRQTVNNALLDSPEKAQTGPAKRGDMKTMRTHLRMLKADKNEEAARVYRAMTSYIRNHYKKQQ